MSELLDYLLEGGAIGFGRVKLRTRQYVTFAATGVIVAVYSRLADGWDDLPYFAGAAALLVVIALVARPWVASAPDGAPARTAGPD